MITVDGNGPLTPDQNEYNRLLANRDKLRRQLAVADRDLLNHIRRMAEKGT